jgi:type IV pilus assembly protein PilZ
LTGGNRPDYSSPWMSEPEEDDRREYSRQPIELKVEYKRVNTFFSDYTRNISKGGTFINTTKPLGIGTEFVFKLYVPRLGEPLSIRGQVQWTLTQEQIDAGAGEPGATPGMGIRFLYEDDAERQGIERRVEKLIVDSLGQLLYSRLMDKGRGHGSGPGSGPGPGPEKK